MLTSVVLLVMAPPASRQVASDLESLEGVSVLLARDCREARLALEAHPDMSLVFTDVSHADGNWADLLRFVVNRGIAAYNGKIYLAGGLPHISTGFPQAQTWEYVRAHNVPYNALHDRNYPSIGCYPCTRQVKPGEDPRAGRWANFTKKECGLHTETGPAQ